MTYPSTETCQRLRGVWRFNVKNLLINRSLARLGVLAKMPAGFSFVLVKPILLGFVFFFSFFTNAYAEESTWRTLGEDFASPVTTDAKWVLLGGSLATATVIAFRDHLDNPFQRYMADHKPLGSWSRVGNLSGQGYLNLAYIAGMFFVAKVYDSESSLNRSVLMLKSTAYTTFLTTVLKGTVRESRPNNPNEHNSWPSGHTSMAFSFASVVAAEHEWYWGAGAYAIATLTAMSRLNDNRHFLRDVMAGATIGASYGLGLYYRQAKTQSVANLNANGFGYVATLVPSDRLDGATFAMSANF